MIKRATLALLLLAAIGTFIFAGNQPDVSIDPEQFARHFCIQNRPHQITKDDLRYIQKLDGFGPESKTYELLEGNLPINGSRLLQFRQENPYHFTEGKCFLLRVLFDLDQAGPEFEHFNLQETLQKIRELEDQITDLSEIINDLKDDLSETINDLKDDLSDLEDQFLELEEHVHE